MPTLSAIMPLYNGRMYIERSLAPLLAMRARDELLEVIVVDDGSSDGSGEIAARLGAKVITVEGRRGPSAARNCGAGIARAEILWFVDADVVVHHDAAREVQAAFAHSCADAVFGSYDDSSGAANFLSQYKNLVHHFYHHRGRGEASTFWSGCGAVTARAFAAVAGFDALRYPRPSIEDIEFGYRLRATGRRIMLWPRLQGTHLKEWRFVNLLHTEVLGRALPWSRLMLGQAGLLDDLNVGRGERMRAVVAGLVAGCMAFAWHPNMPWYAIVLALLVAFALNTKLFVLFQRRRGIAFAFAGILFHQLYYLYSGATFAYCWLEAQVKKLQAALA